MCWHVRFCFVGQGPAGFDPCPGSHWRKTTLLRLARSCFSIRLGTESLSRSPGISGMGEPKLFVASPASQLYYDAILDFRGDRKTSSGNHFSDVPCSFQTGESGGTRPLQVFGQGGRSEPARERLSNANAHALKFDYPPSRAKTSHDLPC